MPSFPISAFQAVVLSGLANLSALAMAQPISVEKPDVIQFGATLEALTEDLEPLCSSLETRRFDPPRLPAETHDQIDCQGFGYFGDDRLAEFVFMDGTLQLVWILVDAEDLDGLEKRFAETYGARTHETDDVVAYADDFAAVRRDIPEALFYSESVAHLAEMRFGERLE
ncbi:MAG: hypothetical protein AAFY34_01655 [Pseudomonadota bacterium]